MSYDVTLFTNEDAQNFGVNAAILLYKMRNFLIWAKANNEHNHKGRYWTYNSISAWKKLIPFLSEKQIVTALKSLRKANVIMTGNFNKNKYDRTTWYSIISEEFEAKTAPKPEDLPEQSITPKGQMDDLKRANRFDQREEPIPNNTPKNTAVVEEERPTSTSPILVYKEFLAQYNLKRLTAQGWIKKIRQHFDTLDDLGAAIEWLAKSYEKKKPYKPHDNDNWVADRISFIENALIKEIRK